MRKSTTRKKRNTGYGSARWLGDEWVDGIARGGRASQAAAEELAREVLHYRRVRKDIIEVARLYGDLLEEKYGRGARSWVTSLALRIATAEEVFGGEKPDASGAAAPDKKTDGTP
jgi:hypothetical protein